MRPVRLITDTLFDSVTARAAASPRRRMNHNFHATHQDNPHRFLNVLLKGTYIQPHRHVDPPKSETFLILEGQVTDRYVLGRRSSEGKTWGVDLAPGVWHTILAISERVICFEVKPGPWEPVNDKDFAPWAPKEGAPDAAAYLAGLAKA